ncbi:HmuY family protein [Rikenella microfusus]|uniref:HmuY family protein n=1 Tax=Rikenella microfusus TaxID=28139 RepID=UPI00248E9B62|nr:HmuY family protein [Rikenella microfusus]
MLKLSLCAAAALCAAMTFNSCKDDKGGDTPPPASGSTVIDAPGFDKWVYFSFDKEAVIETDGSYSALYNSKTWDLAFHRGDIRTNSGPSGCGNGGAYKTSSTDMSTVTEKPGEVTYTIDTKAEISFPDMRTKAEQSKNEALADWYTSSGMPPTYTVNGNVYFIKTAEGKYAKVKFTDYTNDKGEGGHIAFEYEYPVE